jgi:16S rRNA C1402 (ribose-2'-O) methylase RsmI
MKELTKEFSETEVEIVAEKQQQKVIKLIDQQRKIRGLILWQYNQETHELTPAKFKKQDFQITSLVPSSAAMAISNKVQVNENCIYFQALNRKNAIKKLNKVGIKLIR